MLADYRDNRARRKMLDSRATYMRYYNNGTIQ